MFLSPATVSLEACGMSVVVCLTGGAVLLCNVGQNHLQLRETGPGLGSANEAFQVVKVQVQTEDRDMNTTVI